MSAAQRVTSSARAPLADRAQEALEAVAGALAGGSRRDGQIEMARAVAEAIVSRENLLVQAGTGTGKSLGYLVPAILSGRKVAVSTATKALQDQLVRKDLPWLAQTMSELGMARPSFAVLKGRGNYVCRARLGGDLTGEPVLDVPNAAGKTTRDRIAAWAETSETGERSDMPFSVTDPLWQAVSVGPSDCPGKRECPFGTTCFAEQARDKAADADVLVVNHHLVAFEVRRAGVLPERDVYILDEAHEFEEIVADTLGARVSPARLEKAARRVREILEPRAGASTRELLDALDSAVSEVTAILAQLPEGPVRTGTPLGPMVAELIALLRPTVDGLTVADSLAVSPAVATMTAATMTAADPTAAASAAPALPPGAQTVTDTERASTVSTLQVLIKDLQLLVKDDPNIIVFTERSPRGGTSVHAVQLDVSDALRRSLLKNSTLIATSATLTVAGTFDALASRLGLTERITPVSMKTDQAQQAGPAPTEPAPVAPAGWSSIDVGSPFDYRSQAVLYLPQMPPPNTGRVYTDAVHAEIVSLAQAAGGRTLSLFSSTRAAQDAAVVLRRELGVRVLCQGDAPLAQLVEQFIADETSVLTGTMSLWQGVDAAGPSATVVTIDRIPFSRPDDPVATARRQLVDRQGRDGFNEVYLARAATMLTQGVGRLIRSSSDRGVVAVLDSRLTTARYGKVLLETLPPMTLMRDGDKVRAALRRIVAAAAEQPPAA